MKYTKIHDRFIKYFRETKLRDRLERRDSKDERLDKDYIYTEVHHILPRSLDGDNSDNNLVELLPEEHLFIHKLRYKSYNCREDMLAVRFMINGFASKNKHKLCLTKYILKSYAWMKQENASFRKTIGWHTASGRERISKARKGTVVVKDAAGGGMIGSVAVSHPNVLNGTWVHHSTGRILSNDRKNEISNRMSGGNNPNANSMTNDEIIDLGVRSAIDNGRILSYTRMISHFNEEYDIKIPNHRFKPLKGFYDEIELRTGMIYSSMTEERKNNIRLGVLSELENRKK